MCGTYGGGEVHNSLWPWGPVYSLTFTCMKSEYPGHPRGGGGGGWQELLTGSIL